MLQHSVLPVVILLYTNAVFFALGHNSLSLWAVLALFNNCLLEPSIDYVARDYIFSALMWYDTYWNRKI